MKTLYCSDVHGRQWNLYIWGAVGSCSKPIHSWYWWIITCHCWAYPEGLPLDRHCPVFSSWPRRILPLAGPETWPVAWACSDSGEIPRSRCLQAASECESEVGVLLAESRPVSPLLSLMETGGSYCLTLWKQTNRKQYTIGYFIERKGTRQDRGRGRLCLRCWKHYEKIQCRTSITEKSR